MEFVALLLTPLLGAALLALWGARPRAAELNILFSLGTFIAAAHHQRTVIGYYKNLGRALNFSQPAHNCLICRQRRAVSNRDSRRRCRSAGIISIEIDEESSSP